MKKSSASVDASTGADETVKSTHASAASTEKGNGFKVPRETGARDAQVPAQIFRTVPALLQDMVLCSAEACAAGYMDDVRCGAVPSLLESMPGAYTGPRRAGVGTGWSVDVSYFLYRE
jgi:hypothetical protein